MKIKIIMFACGMACMVVACVGPVQSRMAMPIDQSKSGGVLNLKNILAPNYIAADGGHASELVLCPINQALARRVTLDLKNILFVPVPKSFLLNNPQKDGTEINLSDVFRVMPGLSMEKEWRPDYDYDYQFVGGRPIVYALGPNGQREELLAHVICDGTSDGFFQLAMLTLMYDHFYLFWHAEYDAINPIVSGDDFKFLPQKVTANVGPQDILPAVARASSGEVVVTICVFSPFGGLSRVPVRMGVRFPHNPERQYKQETVLVPYQSNICF